MGVLSYLKGRFLPPSSRSFHAFAQDARTRASALQNSIAALESKIEQSNAVLLERLDTHDKQMKLFTWEFYRRENESIDEAKERFFFALPQAKGSMRLIQRGNAQLLSEFKEVCKNLNLPFFLYCGTLLGAARHRGFVPWDDDIDIGMMRLDIESLMAALEQDSRYKITVFYDLGAYCKQIRFRYSDSELPCFVDIFIFEPATCATRENHKEFASLRLDVVNEIKELRNNNPVFAHAYLVEQSDESAAVLQEIFDCHRKRGFEAGLFCFDESKESIIWGLENMMSTLERNPFIVNEEAFPFVELPFEGGNYPVPHGYRASLDDLYGDWHQLPYDMTNHFEHVSRDGFKYVAYRKEYIEKLKLDK